ncbi:MAG: hypothetical protein RSE18_13590 [Acinetobacter sp.]
MKHKVEIKNFSGRLENNLYQDFYACVQLLNLVAVAAGEAQEIIDYSSDDASKYSYKTNVNHAIGVYKDAFIAVVLEPDSVKCIWMLAKLYSSWLRVKRQLDQIVLFHETHILVMLISTIIASLMLKLLTLFME